MKDTIFQDLKGLVFVHAQLWSWCFSLVRKLNEQMLSCVRTPTHSLIKSKICDLFYRFRITAKEVETSLGTPIQSFHSFWSSLYFFIAS